MYNYSDIHTHHDILNILLNGENDAREQLKALEKVTFNTTKNGDAFKSLQRNFNNALVSASYGDPCVKIFYHFAGCQEITIDIRPTVERYNAHHEHPAQEKCFNGWGTECYALNVDEIKEEIEREKERARERIAYYKQAQKDAQKVLTKLDKAIDKVNEITKADGDSLSYALREYVKNNTEYGERMDTYDRIGVIKS